MTALTLVRSEGFLWSEISDHVEKPETHPVNRNECGSYQTFYSLLAIANGNSSCPYYYMTTDGLWFPGPKPPKFHECSFGDIEIIKETFKRSKELKR